MLWVPDEVDIYIPARIVGDIDDDRSDVSVELPNGSVKTFSKSVTYELDPTHLMDMDDLCDMNNLHEAPLLDILRRRLIQERIYTYTGNILISLNPYKLIPGLYDDPLQFLDTTNPDKFTSQTSRDVKKPHVFAIANNALRNAFAEVQSKATSDGDSSDQPNQSIIVTGESGAGKTEASKLILSFLTLTNSYFSHVDNDVLGDRIQDIILQSNAIFEAFGNAKTVRNDNSSRFGKYIKLEYSTGNRLLSASTETFLLEKSRLTSVGVDERNYHVFYQLIRGMPEKEANALALTKVEDFQLLTQGNCTVITSEAADVEDFVALSDALSTMDVSEAEKYQLWQLLAAILHLGNVNCSEAGEAVSLDCSLVSVETVASMLGVSSGALTASLTTQKMQVARRGSVHVKRLSSEETKNNISALIKKIYSSIFAWLVRKVNFTHHSVCSSSEESVKFIGILDIFGFEILRLNSFEQLCINFTNERLQQQFNEHVFILEQQEYAREGLDWTTVSYKDNQHVIDLISKKPTGLLFILEEQGMMNRKPDDVALLNAFNQGQEKNTAYGKSRFGSDGFTVKHFAGAVVYNIDGFLAKNNDSLQDDLTALISNTSNEFLRNVLRQKNGGTPESLGFIPTSDPLDEVAESTEVDNRRASKRMASTVTISFQFRNQLDQLMTTLKQTNPHYVKCIKPNAVKSNAEFSSKLVMEQLRYSGILEVVRIRREGYPTRVLFTHFYKQYEILSHGLHWKSPEECSIEEAKEYSKIITNRYLPSGSFQLGLNFVFLGANGAALMKLAIEKFYSERAAIIQGVYLTRKTRERYLDTLKKIAIVNAVWRRQIYRFRFVGMLLQIVSIQQWYRRRLFRRILAWRHANRWERYMKTGATKIQACFRGYTVRSIVGTYIQAARKLQHLCAKNYRRHLCVQQYRIVRHRIISFQTAFRAKFCRTQFLIAKLSAILIQAEWRRHSGKSKYRSILRMVFLIQRMAQSWILRQRYRRLRNSAVNIQAFVRKKFAKAKFQRQRQAIIAIQAVFRMYRQRCLRHLKLRGLIAVQSVIRTFIARRRFLRVRRCMASLQAAVRRRQARYRYQISLLSCLLLQSQYRRHACREAFLRSRKASILLQSWRRGLVRRNSFRQLRRACLRLQAWQRCRAAKSKWDSLIFSAIVLEAWIRKFVAVRTFHRKKLSSITIQKYIRRHLSQELLAKCHSSCVKLQAWSRAVTARRDFLLLRRAAIKLQAFSRMLSSRRLFNVIFFCSVSAQALIRRFLATRRYNMVRSQCIHLQAFLRKVTAVKKYRSLLVAVLRIQSFSRMVIWRTCFKSAKKRFTHFQSLFRGHVARKSFRIARHSCVQIQTATRGLLLRKQWARQRQAAIKMQSFIRFVCARNYLDMCLYSIMLLQTNIRKWMAQRRFRRFVFSVVVLQSMLRRNRAVESFWRSKYAATTLQAFGRMIMQRRLYEDALFCVIILQAHLRGFLARTMYQRSLHACVRLQSFGRMAICSRRFDEAIVSAIQIQSSWRKAIAVRYKHRCYESCLKISKIVRGGLLRKSLKRGMLAVTILQSYIRMRIQKTLFQSAVNRIVVVQSLCRRLAARKVFEWRMHNFLRLFVAVRRFLLNLQLRKRILALHGSCEVGDLEGVKSHLAAFPGDALIRNKWESYSTMYQTIVRFGHAELLSCFELTPAIILDIDIDGNTLLHYACLNPSLNVLRHLSDILNEISTSITYEVKEEEDTEAENEESNWAEFLGSASGEGGFDNISGLPILRAGWMKKKRKNTLMGLRTWDRRWCILTEETLTYYKSNVNLSRPCGFLPLEGCAIERPGRETIMTITSPQAIYKKGMFGGEIKMGPLTLMCENEREFIDWLTPMKVAAGVAPFRVTPEVHHIKVGIREAWVNLRNNFGQSALHILSALDLKSFPDLEAGALIAASWLLDAGCDVNGLNSTNESPLQQAMGTGVCPTLALLMEQHHADVRCLSSKEYSLLRELRQQLRGNEIGSQEAYPFKHFGPPTRLKGYTYIQLYFEELSSESTELSLDTCHNMYLQVSAINKTGVLLEDRQCLPFPAVLTPDSMWWGSTWYMQTPIENLEQDCIILVQVFCASTLDFNIKKTELFWTYLVVDKSSIDSDLITLNLFRGPMKNEVLLDKRKLTAQNAVATLGAELSLTKKFRDPQDLVERMLGAILWKNWLLKRANALGTCAEILLPVVFMALLILIKSITTKYNSPNIAYYCGQTFPWYYSSSVDTSNPADVFGSPPISCTQQPSQCTTSNYYQEGISYFFGGVPVTGYLQYGYIQSPPEDSPSNNFLYSYTIADETQVYDQLFMSNPSLPIASILQRLQQNGVKLGMAPASNTPQLTIQVQNLTNYIVTLAGDENLRDAILIFDDQSSLDDYMTDRSYDNTGYGSGKIGMAIVLYQADVANAVWDYAVRVNYTANQDSGDEPSVACLYGQNNFSLLFGDQTLCPSIYSIPTTDYYTQDLEKPQLAEYFFGYTYSGFSTLQQVVDKYIFSQYSSTSSVNVMASVSLMPTSSYKSDDFQYVISSTLGIFYMLSFLYPVSRMVRALVVEKETRVKEGMKMMGLTDFVYNLSWLITTLSQMTLIAILITLVTGSTVFEYSNKFLVFFYFEMFSLAVINMCFLMATFFSRSKTASLLGPVIFFASFFPFYAVNDPSFSTNTKTATCLLAPACFALGSTVFADYEGGLVGVQTDNSATMTSDFSYALCVGMMFFDAILYGVLAWYLDKVLPSEFGTPLPLYFPFLPSYWFGDECIGHKRKVAGNKGDIGSPLQNVLVTDEESAENGADTDNEGVMVEEVSGELAKQRMDGRAVRVRRLRKVFAAQGGSERIAVAGLTLDLFEGQVSVLLGHNGAGKSTTINMLVGMIPPTSGDASMCGDLRISENMQAIRRRLGVCPQHDILFPELTAMQHLQMFASFKGVPSGKINDEARRMLAEVGLVEKANAASSTLSGGQKRKLSVGIALIGDSKVVVLDEPTSGMDPYSRRSTWNIIQRNKKGRVILLTTHFMDEADILGDRIAIMSEGKLQCVGSALFLKGAYGVGYTLTVVKQPIDKVPLLESSRTSLSTTSSLSTFSETDQSSEDSPLKLASRSKPQGALHEEHCRIVTRAITSHIPVAEPLSTVGAEQSFRLPFAASSNLADLFVDLDANKDRYGIAEYGISVTTLEEVFMRVGRAGHGDDQTVARSSLTGLPVDSATPVVSEKEQLDYDQQVLKKTGGDLVSTTPENAKETADYWEEDKSCFDTFFYHFRALLLKRLIYGKRDQRMVICQLVLPVLLVVLGLGLLLIRPGLGQPDYILSSQQYNPSKPSSQRNFVPFSIVTTDPGAASTLAQLMESNFDNNAVMGQAVDISQDPGPFFPSADTAGTFYGCSVGAQPLYNMSTYLLHTQNINIGESGSSRYGAVTLDGATNTSYLGYNILVNASAMHGVGVYVNEVHQSYLQATTGIPKATIQTRNYPLPRTYSQDTRQAAINAFVAALFCMIAFCFIPASFVTFVVKEREVKAKHQQIISGVSIYAYWCSTFVFDSMSYLPTAALVIAVVWAYGIDAYTSSQGGGAFALLFILFGPAVASFTYMLSYAFSSHSTAQIVIMFFNFLTGLCLMVVSFVLTTIPSTQELNLSLRYLFRLFPSFCLGDGLVQLALCSNDQCPGIGSSGYNFAVTQGPFAWDIAGGNIVFLVWETVVYFLVALGIEYSMTFPSLLAWIYKTGLEDKGAGIFEDEDEDVAAERRRVMSGDARGDIVRLEELRKVYQRTGDRFNAMFHACMSKIFCMGDTARVGPNLAGPKLKVAVQSLCFGIPKGECFGFLGINGAGKTTTLSILSGEFPPTTGTAYIDGFNISEDQSKIRRRIGYCPQFDALLELMTAREHIELYGRVKGMRGEKLKRVVEGKLDQLDLRDFENKLAGSLSGGNKRKLSVAMATIGEPPIVFLDEPSTGMDPVARRFMWQVISRMSTQDGRCSVILTTHSMEEAEALCTRIGVMVNGRLRCLGSSQHLKLRFGDGFEVNVKTRIPSPTELVQLVQTCASRMPSGSSSTPELDSIIHIDPSSVSSQMLEDARVHQSHLPAVLHTLQLNLSVAAPTPELQDLLDMFGGEGGNLSLQMVLEWVWAEKAARTLNRFMQMLGRGEGLAFDAAVSVENAISASSGGHQNGFARLLERSSAHNFRYRLRVQTPQVPEHVNAPSTLAYVFRKFEANKEKLHVQEYSVGQTTLEQIFNQFAASQENPEVAAIQSSGRRSSDAFARASLTSSPLSYEATGGEDDVVFD